MVRFNTLYKGRVILEKNSVVSFFCVFLRWIKSLSFVLIFDLAPIEGDTVQRIRDLLVRSIEI